MLINPCNISASPNNTGTECSDAMKATAAIIMVPTGKKWTVSDMADFTTYVKSRLHDTPANRWYLLFGTAAPIKNITDANESDVIETHEDGSVSFVRYGKYNRTFVTTKGGLCLAQALMAFVGLNYSFIEIDITGQVAMMKNSDGTFSGFPTELAYAPAPILATLKTAYKNQFMLSFSPETYIKRGKVFAQDSSEAMTELKSLLDVEVSKAAAGSVTKLKVSVKTECGETDLVDLYGNTLGAVVGNFVVKNKATGAVVTPTAAAIVAGIVELTGTYVSAQTYTVGLSAPSVLLAAGIEGYDTNILAEILIP